jgi:hypothetical protein
MFFHNNTQAFMAAKFTEEEDYCYIHKLARESNGEEKSARRNLLISEINSRQKKLHAKKFGNKMLRQLQSELHNHILSLIKKKFQDSKAWHSRTN